ncbi:helix-turn-helix transcriptional regulator [Dermatophilus congolensis]|uniref:helix-turn-helix transcriptional regulator n=1 Tax=Dermatophilus congolensis TaxID=1863 RepID=UPI001AAF60AE|nr:WYL domain-containing protein [Dermatophilus congolensis]MBO3142972.1 WYL domain-containing protein [Dermatophilus congolensis]MBO3151961.1 WYL domain-containing protein [Dermatophilus congolensis]MBO3161031.1 WYL domain-containing protein [Dermatophilus congolensis]MBO3163245.1 WYL domain-containing protein [Dermatophilus congolensis]MBO3176802.1 WYL domain-containing protein [Dermatophilus congolensis]
MKSSRLLSILLLLQTYERMTSKELARRFEVSARTILRDVQALSAAGVPIYTEQGRGGAIVLDRRARLDVARLDPLELQLLSVAGLDTALLTQVGLHAVQARAQEKLTAAAARAPERNYAPLSEVLFIDPSGWFTTGRELDLTDLLNAARERRRIRVCYRRSGQTSGQWVIADPYGLASKAGSWYLVADVDGQPRMFNTSRIEGREFLTDAAVLRSECDLRSVWQELVSSFQPPPNVQVRALLRSTRVDLAQRILGTRMAHTIRTDDEWTPITVHYPDVESVRQLLQFGDHIRLLSPPEAVERFGAIATQMMRAHQSSSSSTLPDH